MKIPQRNTDVTILPGWQQTLAELRPRLSTDIDPAEKDRLMRVCLEEAMKSDRIPFLEKAPKVGALVVKDGEIVGRGRRVIDWLPPEEAWGEQALVQVRHAEHVALEAAGAHATGADLYTTLEPCSYRPGKWYLAGISPCCRLIPEFGVRRVIFGIIDPHPRICGAGLKHLLDAGIEVEAYAGELGRELWGLLPGGG